MDGFEEDSLTGVVVEFEHKNVNVFIIVIVLNLFFNPLRN